MNSKLKRTTFSTSRLLDFCSRKELVAQTGHEVSAWPLVVLKELLDNAIDACEDAEIDPEVEIHVDERGITVVDNGPGIPGKTVESMLDFSVRVSSREAYVSPTRGAQGNALKTIVAMPFVLDGERGRAGISAQGLRHRIELTVDPIRQEPVIKHTVEEAQNVKKGSAVSMTWPDSACSILHDARCRFLQLADDFTWLNPHLKLNLAWFGDQRQVAATTRPWAKWLPSEPTSPHWYDVERLSRLMSAYIAHDAESGHQRTVREVVREFRSLSGSAKQKRVLSATGLARTNLGDLVRDGAGLDAELIGALLSSMKEHSRPVKPKALGLLGEDHLRERFAGEGCQMETFKYKRMMGEEGGVPYVVETAFGYCPEVRVRRLVTGVNWSPGIINPFRQLGRLGQSLDTVLETQRAGCEEDIILVLHVACPRVEYTDRGKSAVVIGDHDA